MSGGLKLGFKYLKLDRGESSEDTLAAAVIGPLDPRDDGDAQILSRLPTLAIATPTHRTGVRNARWPKLARP